MEVDGIDIGRLHDAVHDSYRDLQKYRVKTAMFIRQYAGKEYADNETVPENPVNQMELAVSIYSHRLAANAPRADVRTEYMRLRPYAETLRLAVDYLSQKLNLKRTLRDVVTDALFGMGVVKVGINDTEELIRGFSVEGGQPFAERVSMEDFVFDTTAKDWNHCQFIGNRFYVDGESLKAAAKNGIYENVDRITEAGNGPSMGSGELRSAEMTGGLQTDLSRYRKRYLLWEIWLPFENRIVTLDEDLDNVLKVQEWTGPRTGPYSVLSFNDVPDNILPLPPAASWVELHIFINEMWRKIFRQARREKSILAFAGQSEKDAERIRNAADGEVARVDNIRDLMEARFGGPDQQLLGLATGLDPVFSRIAGNLDTAGGLGAMSPTATQDAILNQNSSSRFDRMVQRVSEFTSDVLKALAWWMWTDPYIQLPLVKRIGDTIELEVTFDDRMKKGEFLDYNFQIVPYSMVNRTPEQMFQSVVQVIQSLYQPFAELAMQQGVQIDMRELFRMAGRCLDIPELNGVLSIGEPMTPPSGGEASVDKPPTHSVYERISRPAAGYQSQMNAISRAAMGENLQKSVRDTIGGPTQ